MSKLFKLKQWLTIGETANHLSNVLSEPVSEADVLKLGLDKHLKLSVIFVNSAPVKVGKVVTYRDAKRNHIDYDKAMAEFVKSLNIPNETADKTPNEQEHSKALQGAVTSISDYFDVPEEELLYDLGKGSIIGLYIGGGLVCELEHENITHIKGIFDLPLIFNDRIDVEWRYNQLALGVDLDAISLEGAWVSGDGNTMYQVQEWLGDYHGYEEAKRKQQDKLRKLQFSKISNKRKEKILELRKAKLKEANDKWEQWYRKDRYYPAGKLPDDSVLVVRTSAIEEFEYSMTNKPDIDSSQHNKSNANALTNQSDKSNQENINYQSWGLYENFDVFTAAALWCKRNPYYYDSWSEIEYIEVRNLIIQVLKHQFDAENYPVEKRNAVILELGKRFDAGRLECMQESFKFILSREQLSMIAMKMGVWPHFLFGTSIIQGSTKPDEIKRKDMTEKETDTPTDEFDCNDRNKKIQLAANETGLKLHLAGRNVDQNIICNRLFQSQEFKKKNGDCLQDSAILKNFNMKMVREYISKNIKR